MPNAEEQGLANTLAAATDQDRASILADESDAPQTSKKRTIKNEMKLREHQDIMSTMWAKVHNTVSAAQEAARKKKEDDPKLDTETLFKDSVKELNGVLGEMVAENDMFAKMKEEADSLRLEM